LAQQQTETTHRALVVHHDALGIVIIKTHNYIEQGDTEPCDGTPRATKTPGMCTVAMQRVKCIQLRACGGKDGVA